MTNFARSGVMKVLKLTCEIVVYFIFLDSEITHVDYYTTSSIIVFVNCVLFDMNAKSLYICTSSLFARSCVWI